MMHLKAGGPARRHLQGIEAAPGDAEHADRAAAPGLASEPGDHLQCIVLLLLHVFVRDQPVAVAGAPDVDARTGIAVAGEVVVHGIVAQPHGIALAIGQIFQQRRHGIACGILGQPQARRQPRAVGERNPFVLDDADGAGKFGDHGHARRRSSRTTIGIARARGACERSRGRK
jgi:hypothetical protein